MESFLAGLYSLGSMHIAAVALSGSTRRFKSIPPRTAIYTLHAPSTKDMTPSYPFFGWSIKTQRVVQNGYAIDSMIK
jgi:hypothetical protein